MRGGDYFMKKERQTVALPDAAVLERAAAEGGGADGVTGVGVLSGPK
jgi:hypothetical protein